MNASNSAMDPDARREAELFQAAALLSGEARVTFLNGACHGNAALRHRLETLLAAHDAGDSFLEPEDRKPDREPVKTIKLDLADAPDEAVGQTLGRYKLLERVGEGGCGVVYVAEQTEPVRRRVALKVIKLGMDTKQVVARFEAERQALAMMDHPNIAKVLDAGTTDVGRPFFVMELVRGIRITDYCDQASLGTRDRLELFIKVCQAIQHAHQKGIIHRDIKPSNILVTLNNGVSVPKVIDFGIAKAVNNQLLTDKTVYTALQQFIGTPAYMSPEQAQMSSVDVDTRTDIYSLGVLLYEMLTGRTPFDAKELISHGFDAMRKTILEKEPPRPSTRLAMLQRDELTTTAKHRSAEAPKLIRQLSGDLDWIVMKCLEKDRERRYETSDGLAADVQRHLNTEPVMARPPNKLYEFRKTVRRHKFGFAATAAIIVVLAAGVVASSWQAVRATRSERQQKQLRLVAEEAQQRALGAHSMVLGNYPGAEYNFRMAVEIGRQLPPDNNQTLPWSLCGLGYAQQMQGRLVEAEAQYREALAIQKKLPPSPEVASSTVDTLLNLQSVLSQQNKLAEAELVFGGIIDFQKKLPGTQTVKIAWSLCGLGSVLERQGRFSEAEARYREALELQEKLLANGSADYKQSVIDTLRNLESVLTKQNNLAEAEAINQEIARRQKLYGLETSQAWPSRNVRGP